MKKLFLFLLVFSALGGLTFNCFAQTNVSGGIYANATWTLTGSPYIVVDTTVVFPGVTLTIQPGVVVKFNDHKYIEIRQANLIAEGTNIDSIIFTSNNATPTPGIWGRSGYGGGIWLHGYSAQTIASFNYCRFDYATTAIYSEQDSLFIKNSNFIKNLIGLDCYTQYSYIDTCNFRFNTTSGIDGNIANRINYCNVSNNGNGFNTYGEGVAITNCIVDSNQIGFNDLNYSSISNCTVNHNQQGLTTQSGWLTINNCVIDSNSVVGIFSQGSSSDSIVNCEIKNNGIGIDDYSDANIIVQCVIENNTIGIKLHHIGDNIYCNRICNNTSYDLYYNVLYGSNFSMPNNLWCTLDSLSTEARIYDGYDNINLGLVSFMPLDVNNCYLTGCNIYLTPHVTNATCDTCHNGAASVTIANGFAPYSYSWFTSPMQTAATATGLASGTYTVCVTDGHGCTACNYNVFVDSTNCTGFAMNATATNATCSLCSDGTATANITAGTPPYNYTWYTSPIQSTQTATGLPAGTYAVCVTDLYGCAACDTITVGIGSCSAYYTVTATGNPHEYNLINYASGTPPLTYDWNWGDGSPHDTAAYPTHTYSGAGTYNICLSITDSAGCTSNYCHSFYLLSPNSNAVTVNVIPPVANGVPKNSGEKMFSVFPNPASNDLLVRLPANTDKAELSIYNVLGEIKYQSALTEKETYLDITALSQGLYIIEVSAGKQLNRLRFVKQ